MGKNLNNNGMKLKLLLIILLASIGVNAQTFTNFNAYGLQRKIVGSDTTWRFVGSGSNGFRYFNPNGILPDSTIFRTVANSYSLSAMQMKLNDYTLQTRSISTGFGLTGGGNFTANRTFIVDTTQVRSVLNSYTKAQVNALISSASPDSTVFRTTANSLTLAQLQSRFNLYTPLNGAGATGTWGINISGISAFSTLATNSNNWGSVPNNFAFGNRTSDLQSVIGKDGGGTAYTFTAGAVRTFINSDGLYQPLENQRVSTSNSVTFGNVTAGHSIFTGTGNTYNIAGLETRGNGSSVKPIMGFHQPGDYAGAISLMANSQFAFFNDDGTTYANINLANATINGTPTASSNQAARMVDLDSYIPLTQKAAASGVATLDGSGKVPLSQLPTGSEVYKGTWNASTNTPTLIDGTGTNGWKYIVNVAGTQNLGSGSVSYLVGDAVIYNGTIWQKVASGTAVTSVNTYTGAVVLVKGDIGLGNVDNTTDLNKPVSTAQQTALDLKLSIATAASTYQTLANLSTSTSLGTSNTLYPSQLAVKTYVDANVPALTNYALKDGTNSTGTWTISTTGNALTATTAVSTNNWGSIPNNFAFGIRTSGMDTFIGQDAGGTAYTFSSGAVASLLGLSSYLTASSTNTLTNKSGNISQWTNDSGYITTDTKWDGGATGLTASTGRTSLGGTTVGQNIFTLTNPSAIRFIRLNADNSVDALNASDFRTAIGAGSAVIDSTQFRTVANSYSLAGMQTKLNNYTLQSRTFSAGYGLAGGGDFTSNKTIYADSTVVRSWSNSLSLAQLQTRFNLKQNLVTLTTTGTGAATFNQSTGALNIPTPSGGGGGTVTSVTSANTDISVANTTSTPVLTLNSGLGASKIVKRDADGAVPITAGSRIWTVGSNDIAYQAAIHNFYRYTSSTISGHFMNMSNTGSIDELTIFPQNGTFPGLLNFGNLKSGTTTPTPSGTEHQLTIDANGLVGHRAFASSTTNLALGTPTSTTYPITNSNGTGFTLPSATTTDAGLFNASDKTKLDGIASGANNYSLPVATASVLGGVKQGTGVAIDGSGVISALTQATSGTYTPTVANVSNTSSLSLTYAAYTRIGDIVTVDAIINYTTTSGVTSSQVSVTLPFDVCSNNAVTGIASVVGANEAGIVDYNSNTSARVYFPANALTGARVTHIRFTYTVTD